MKEQGQTKKIANKYTILLKQILGKGTFATTYKCRLKPTNKTQTPQLLACKIMNKSEILALVPNLQYLMERVRVEAKAWKQLQHENIVKFQDCKQTSNNIYFFLEYCAGGSLEAYITKNRFVKDSSERVTFAKQLISACAYLQRKNTLHRDIKPANILIHQGKVKLGDFGLARVIDEDYNKSFFTFAGTLQFMAPQILRAEKYPYKCDVWSVGVTIFVMFTNELPYGLTTKDNSQQLILSKLDSRVEEFDYPVFKGLEPLVDLLKKMLTLDPHARPKMTEIQQECQNMELK